jgi:tetratricopeptide (TPR) repeat protein
MRNVLLVSWLLLPIAAFAYHEGPGQDRLALDRMDQALHDARVAADAGRWKAAAAAYTKALELQPKDGALAVATAQRIELERQKAKMRDGGNAEAREELEELVEQIAGTEGHDPQLLAEARQALARTQFYNTWLLRLEGFDRDVWEPEIEAARQNWRLARRAGRRRSDCGAASARPRGCDPARAHGDGGPARPAAAEAVQGLLLVQGQEAEQEQEAGQAEAGGRQRPRLRPRRLLSEPADLRATRATQIPRSTWPESSVANVLLSAPAARSRG